MASKKSRLRLAEIKYCEELQEWLTNPKNEDFTLKWSCAESVLKLIGSGFSDAGRVIELSKDCKTEVKLYSNPKNYVISTSVKR